ncbi:hypothetical protein [Kutzneria sp. 744]|uniref:hypothetical protein n=1 Tax=Kutzneria sp. (strain 744) TaxID=345341 RepID=UPI0005BBBA98|nr:hypothetical protein [Kutzneria sp. 744]
MSAATEPVTAPLPSLQDARVVTAPALREAALVLDAVAAVVSRSDADTAAGIRKVVADLEAGDRIDRPCCDNPWKPALTTALTP